MPLGLVDNFQISPKISQILRWLRIAGVINAMFCGCPARGEQNGIKSNVIALAMIESPK